MPVTSSGVISITDIVAEFGGSAPHSMSEYYGKDTVPASGTISISDFYGTSDYITITAGTTYILKTAQHVRSNSGCFVNYTFGGSNTSYATARARARNDYSGESLNANNAGVTRNGSTIVGVSGSSTANIYSAYVDFSLNHGANVCFYHNTSGPNNYDQGQGWIYSANNNPELFT